MLLSIEDIFSFKKLKMIWADMKIFEKLPQVKVMVTQLDVY